MKLLMNKTTDKQVRARCRNKGMSMVLLGEKGMGKRLVSEQIAASDLGTTPDKLQYCPGYTLLEPESGLITGDMLRAAFDRTVYRSSKKPVIIIDDADRMSEAAQDRLLKTLEDGSEQSTVLLVCHDNPAGTIMSRCGILRFPQIDIDTLRSHFGADADETALLGCKGAPGRYIRLSNDAEYLEMTRNVISTLLLATERKELRSILDAAHCYKEKDSGNAAEIFDSFQTESFFFAMAEVFKSTLIENLGVKSRYRLDFRNISGLYSEEELLFLLRRSAALAGICPIKGRFNKNDFFGYMMDLINPDVSAEMEDKYAVC